MAKTRGSKEGIPRDSSVSMPSEQKNSESNKQKISRIHDIFPTLTKDNIAKILQYYEDDESQALDALTRDGGREALSNWAESGSLKNKNNKNKKKKKKARKDGVSGMSATASFDADDSSSLHSGGNIDAEVEKDPQQTETENSILNDVDKISIERISNDEELVSNEPETESKPTHSVCAPSAPEEPSPPLDCDSEQIKIPSPSPDASEKPEEPVMKKDKYRSMDNNYQKYPQRQRTNSFRRSKSSSVSEDQSSQSNSQSAAAPTKRGYEKCKKDLNRQTISLQRISSQVDKGFDDSTKKIKSVFADIFKNLEQRQKVLEAELEKNKIDAMNLIKGRQDLAVDLKRRVDRTSQLSEAEWSDLRSDIKQFVTERKYDDDLGKTIWFHWTDINETIKSFGEVTPVKNVYSQRSQSTVGNSATNNPGPSPSSSLANDEVESAADKNDVADISAVEQPTVEKEEVHTYNKTHSSENRPTRVYSNTKFNHGRFPGGNYHGQGYRNPRGGYNNHSHNRNFSYGRQNNYEGNYRNHPHHERDGRMNEGPYISDRNMNNPKDFKYKNQRGNNRNFNYNNNRYRNNNMGGHRHQEKHPEEPTLSASGNAEKPNVNGFVNN